MNIFLHVVMSIFFDSAPYSQDDKDIYNPQDLTEHYRREIVDLSLDGIYIASHYHSIASTIESYKYRSDRRQAGEYVDLLAEVIEKYGLLSTDDIVFVGVPMHWSRYMIRGFNHIDLLVSELSKKMGVSQSKPIRAFFTQRQSKLSKIKRMRNREHAFGLRSGYPLPKIIILIDDIISTGSTAQACANILKVAGAERVYGVFIASNQ